MAEGKKYKGVGAKAPDKGKGPRGTVTLAIPLAEGRPPGPPERPRFATHYGEKVLPALMEKFKYASVMQAPRLLKIVVNMGVGDATVDIKNLDAAVNELAQITGQKPSVRKAKKAISNFKLRQGLPISAMF